MTFSLDGAREATHDQLRVQALPAGDAREQFLCRPGLPFTLNMVLTAQNRHEVAAMVGLAHVWGAGGCALAI